MLEIGAQRNSEYDVSAVTRLGHTLEREHVGHITAQVVLRTARICPTALPGTKAVTAASELDARLRRLAVRTRAAGSAEIPDIPIAAPTDSGGRLGDAHDGIRHVVAASRSGPNQEHAGARP